MYYIYVKTATYALTDRRPILSSKINAYAIYLPMTIGTKQYGYVKLCLKLPRAQL